MIIAVDGSAASGKGTLSKRLADHFDLAHLDTGSLYRALSLQLLNTGTNADDIDENQAIRESLRLDLSLCSAPEIRTDRVASTASKVAALPRCVQISWRFSKFCKRPSAWKWRDPRRPGYWICGVAGNANKTVYRRKAGSARRAAIQGVASRRAIGYVPRRVGRHA